MFSQTSLKLIKIINESIEKFILECDDDLLKVTDIERRVAIENEIFKEWEQGKLWPSMTFDETGDYICYSSPIGIKCLNLTTFSVTRILGKTEKQRFL